LTLLMRVWKKMEAEWLTEDEWELEWQLFQMLEDGLVEVVGLDEYGEPKLKFTRKFYQGYADSIRWDEPEDDD
jgi:hypothetical protein